MIELIMLSQMGRLMNNWVRMAALLLIVIIFSPLKKLNFKKKRLIFALN